MRRRIIIMTMAAIMMALSMAVGPAGGAFADSKRTPTIRLVRRIGAAITRTAQAREGREDGRRAGGFRAPAFLMPLAALFLPHF